MSGERLVGVYLRMATPGKHLYGIRFDPMYSAALTGNLWSDEYSEQEDGAIVLKWSRCYDSIRRLERKGYDVTIEEDEDGYEGE